jgi:hypothetical protein
MIVKIALQLATSFTLHCLLMVPHALSFTSRYISCWKRGYYVQFFNDDCNVLQYVHLPFLSHSYK